MSPIEKDQIIEGVLALSREDLPTLDGLPRDVEQVLRCLHKHLFDESSVDAIIAYSRAQKTSIYGRFKVYIGMSIRDYWEDRRMKAAMQLLRYDELEIYLIAYRLGYGSHSSFSRAFRRHVGHSPKAHREKMYRENV